MANPYSRPLLLSQLLTLGLVSSASANLVFEANFDDATNQIGGTTSFSSLNANVDSGTSSADPFGSGSYAYVTANADLGSGNVGGITFDPTAAANSWGSMQTLNGAGFNTLNGGFDAFLHIADVGTDGFVDNWTRPLSYYNNPATGGMRLIMYGTGGGNQFRVEFITASNGLLEGGTTATGSLDMFGSIAGGFQEGSTYHYGLTFETDVDNLVTASLFIQEGTGAIDTTVGAAATTTFKIDGSIVSTGLGSGAWTSTIGGRSFDADNETDRSIYGDSYRLYDDTPDTFGAIPEPSAFALILGSAIAGIVFVRRRRS